MENNTYGKRPLWQWILLYVVIAIVLYGLIYYFFFAGNNSYSNNTQLYQNNNTQTTNNTLDLSNRGLTAIPQNIFSQTNLEELNISNNKLSGAIPSQIGSLVNLKILNASNNAMTGVPAEIGQLQKLEVLDLSNNKITGLPNELGNLINLKTLNLSGNQYSQQDLAGIRAKLPNTNFILNQTQTNNPTPATVSVAITNFAFSPANLTVHKGDTVKWTNNDSAPHTVTGDNGGPASQRFGQGQTYSYTFSTIGTFSYHCSVHPNMKAVVQVIE